MANHNTEKLLRIAKIIAAEKLGKLNQEEEIELKNWLSENAQNSSNYMKLQDSENLFEDIQEMNSYNAEKSFHQLKNKLSNCPESSEKVGRMALLWKYAAAILLLFALGIITYILINNRSPQTLDAYTELKPGTQKAILITSNREEIVLGNTDARQVFTESKTRITDTSYTLIYENIMPEKSESPTARYNEVITPRGGEYTLILSDGTRVQLNADSKIRFPVRFNDDIRAVELEGEAFFDVSHAKKTAFLVKTELMQVRVYGTRFNVSAYPNDAEIHTTLVEGSVDVEVAEEKIKIIPGQQLKWDRNTSTVEIREVNTELFAAWTKGLFVFDNEHLSDILTKLSRWYDFEVSYESEDLKQSAFTGDLRRYDDIKPILDMISIASDIEFKIENRIIQVYKNQ